MATQTRTLEDKAATAVARLQAARVDGRLENVRYRQDQLQFLHKCLGDNSREICDAIHKDSGCTSAEALVEFFMAMEALRHHYDVLDFDHAIKEEYCVLKGLDDLANVVGFGMVYIKPATTSPFFSILAPLTAAISAGNCVIVELPTSLQLLHSVMRKLLPTALDLETFAVVDQAPSNLDFLKHGTLVIQSEAESSPPVADHIICSPSTSRTVAVVDRTANVQEAAKVLIMARFAYGGKSPYAPDVVLVNEFVKKVFLEAACKEAIAYLDTEKNEGDLVREKRSLRSAILETVQTTPAEIVTLASRGGIVEVKSRNSGTLRSKLEIPMLVVLSSSSLDDSIDYATSRPGYEMGKGIPYLATYVFANPASAKYLAQFIPAQVSFLNHIPPKLLVGPAGPRIASQPLSVAYRYEKSMFEATRARYVLPSPQDSKLHALLTANNSHNHAALPHAGELMKISSTPLKPTNQALQARSIGFFEQGILTGLAAFWIPPLVGIGGAAFFGARYLYRLFR